MKQRIILFSALMLVILFSALSFATETRVGSMGGVGLFVKDNSNIFSFPGTIHQYSNEVVAELRSKNNDDMYTLGMLMSGSSDRVFGIYLNRPLNIPAEVFTLMQKNVELRRATSLFYGSKMTNYDFGIVLSIGMDKYSDENSGVEDKQNARYIGLSAGISNETMDLGLLFELPKIKQEIGDATDEWGGTGIGIQGRLFSVQSSEMEYVGAAGFYTASTKREYDSGISGFAKDETDLNLKRFRAGGAVNYQMSKNNLIVLAVEALGINKKTIKRDNYEGTTTVTTLPGIYLGMESQVKPWLIGRLGARQVYQSTKEEEDVTGQDKVESTTFDSIFNMFFGLGIISGNLELDANMNEGIFFDGPNFITGTTNALAYSLSLTYHFNKK